MLSYKSKSEGIRGILKSCPEDFLVEEITPKGDVLDIGRKAEFADSPGVYTHFILQKRNWATSSAISEIAAHLHSSQKKFNIAGTKDKLSISTQIASAHGVPKDRLLELRIKDISINGAWSASDRVHLGELLGNRFTIALRGCLEDSAQRCDGIFETIREGFLNYFGEQRFGSSRGNTHLIGQRLLQNDPEGALWMFLCDAKGEKNPVITEARTNLHQSRDFAKALAEFPRHMRLERSMLSYLAKHPEGYINALRCLPRNILLLFIHAFQSSLFNQLLSTRIAEGALELEEGEYYCGESLGFPDISKSESEGWICGKLIGYSSPLNTREQEILDDFGITKESFRMKIIPELSSRGSYRTLMAPMKDLSYSSLAPDAMRFRFELPSGSYATVAMREFTGRR